jgi:hypothetical protein
MGLSDPGGLSGDEWSCTIQTSRIHLALFSRPGIYAGAGTSGDESPV